MQRIQHDGLTLKVIHGHFATSHSHTNYFIDINTLKSRQSEAHAVARELASHYATNTIVDTILCVDGTDVVGAYLADELTQNGICSMNAHHTIYITAPQYDQSGKLFFLENILPMIRGKNILLLMAAVASDSGTVHRVLECLDYYGSHVSGICAVFRSADSVAGIPIRSVFSCAQDLPDYESYPPHDCPWCDRGQQLDALVTPQGYTRL